jgi:nucleotide-binding universal stress UspA family protein
MAGFTPHRILVPVNGSATDEDVVRLACRLALRQRARVFVITIVEVRRGLPLSSIQSQEVAAAEALLDRAEALGKEYEVDMKVELLQAREAASALVEEVTAREADLMVVGLPFRERFGEFFMGKTVPFILRNARCRVLLLRESPPPD